jgi:hypothetical protein
MSREGVPLLVIQRHLGHADLGITSAYLRGIDNTEIIHAVDERPAPMIPAGATLAPRRRVRIVSRRSDEMALGRPARRPRHRRRAPSSVPTRTAGRDRTRRDSIIHASPKLSPAARRRWAESDRAGDSSPGTRVPHAAASREPSRIGAASGFEVRWYAYFASAEAGDDAPTRYCAPHSLEQHEAPLVADCSCGGQTEAADEVEDQMGAGPLEGLMRVPG